MRRDQQVIRPRAIIITLVLMGISTLFAGLCAAYLYTIISGQLAAPLPPTLFFVNIPVLMTASIVLKRSKITFENHNVKSLEFQLGICLALTLVFILLQILGWMTFFRQIPLAATQARSFVFVLSALHLTHVLAGIPFLIKFIWSQRMGVTGFVVIGEQHYDYLKGLSRYWNFLDILWILLVLVLLSGYSIRWL